MSHGYLDQVHIKEFSNFAEFLQFKSEHTNPFKRALWLVMATRKAGERETGGIYGARARIPAPQASSSCFLSPFSASPASIWTFELGRDKIDLKFVMKNPILMKLQVSGVFYYLMHLCHKLKSSRKNTSTTWRASLKSTVFRMKSWMCPATFGSSR